MKNVCAKSCSNVDMCKICGIHHFVALSSSKPLKNSTTTKL